MALDESHVGTLLRVEEDSSKARAFILSIIGREEFLIDDEDAEFESKTQIIDIGQSVLNYLLSFEDVNHELLRLHDFVRHEDMEDVDVMVSPSLVACGYGRFLVEVSVSVPSLTDNDDDDNGLIMEMLFRKFFIISSTVGAIIWMADNTFVRRVEYFSLSSRSTEEGGRYGCLVAAVACWSPNITLLSIDSCGDFHQPTVIYDYMFDPSQSVPLGWTSCRLMDRPIALCGSEFVKADNMSFDYGQRKKEYMSQLVFGSSLECVPLQKGFLVDRLVNIRSTHVLAICKFFSSTVGNGENDGGAAEEGLNDIAGHWFGDGQDDQLPSVKVAAVSAFVILFDLQSRKEIYRICLVDDLRVVSYNLALDDYVLPLLVAESGGTVAASVWWSGICMTGEDVRESSFPNNVTTDAMAVDPKTINVKKTKKKKGVKKNNKKDGFARGMSLRG